MGVGTAARMQAAVVDNFPEKMQTVDEATMLSLDTAVDICPERVDAADAEGPRPPRFETAVEF